MLCHKFSGILLVRVHLLEKSKSYQLGRQSPKEVSKSFLAEYTGFEFNQVVINKDFKITKHLDASNVGESMIIALGDYIGGKLVIERNGGTEAVNIRHKFYKFNGSEEYHWVEDFENTRYSLVFYNIKK